MRVLVLSVFFQLCCVCLFGQQVVDFMYDESGNCIKKYLTVELPSKASDNPLDTVSKTDNIGDVAISVYPNPTDGLLRVVVSGAEQHDFDFRLIDAGGRLLQQFRSRNEINDVDMTYYTSGVYVLVLYVDNKRSVFRIIKK